jgi:hypothetical protein
VSNLTVRRATRSVRGKHHPASTRLVVQPHQGRAARRLKLREARKAWPWWLQSAGAHPPLVGTKGSYGETLACMHLRRSAESVGRRVRQTCVAECRSSPPIGEHKGIVWGNPGMYALSETDGVRDESGRRLMTRGTSSLAQGFTQHSSLQRQ